MQNISEPNKFFSSEYISGKLKFSSNNWKENLNSMSFNERLFFLEFLQLKS